MYDDLAYDGYNTEVEKELVVNQEAKKKKINSCEHLLLDNYFIKDIFPQLKI